MDQLTGNDAKTMVQAIKQLHDDVGIFFNECGLKAAANSQATSELKSFGRPKSLTTAYSQGTIFIEVAADQLVAFTKTLTEPIQTVAPWSCLRAFVESCALAAWILEPSIDARTRVQRSFALRYEELSEEAKFFHASGEGFNKEKVLRRINQIEKDALEIGFARVENKKRERCGIGQPMPSITNIITNALNEEAFYRLLSAMTHAHNWALIQLSFQRINKRESSFIDNSGDISKVHLLEKHLLPFQVAFLCRKAASIFPKPLIYKCKLFGWDTEQLKSSFHLTFTSLGIKYHII